MFPSTEGSERKARDERKNNGSIKDNGIWITRHNNELYTFYCEPDIVQVIKIERLRCSRHLFRGQELGP
jgi:hypothetical protein